MLSLYGNEIRRLCKRCVIQRAEPWLIRLLIYVAAPCAFIATWKPWKKELVE